MSSVKWDGTINLGSVIALIGIAGSVIGGSAVAISKIEGIQQTMKVQGEGVERRLKSLEEGFQQMRIDMAVKDGIAAQVQDHEQRLRAVERGH